MHDKRLQRAVITWEVERKEEDEGECHWNHGLNKLKRTLRLKLKDI